METALEISGLLPAVCHYLNKGIRGIHEIRELLRDGNDMEKLVHGLKELLDGLKGAEFSQVPEPYKALYTMLEERCTKLYETMREIKNKPQRHQDHPVITLPNIYE